VLHKSLILLGLFFRRLDAFLRETALAVGFGFVKRHLPTKLSTDAVHKIEKRLQNRRLSKSLKVYFKFVGQGGGSLQAKADKFLPLRA